MTVPFTNVTGSATISTTEFSLVTASTTPGASTTANQLEPWIDASAMAASDQFRVRVVDKVNGGTATVAFEAFLTGVQAQLYRVPPLRVGEGWDVRITKIAGTDRAIGWSLREDVGDVSGGALSAGAITSATFAAGAINAAAIASAALTAAKFAADAIDSNAIAASAVTEIQSGLATASAVASVASSVSAIISAVASLPGAATIAAAVWATTAEAGETFGDAVRNITARLFGAGTVQDGDGVYVYKSKDGSKTRLAMTRTGTARTVSTRDGT